MAGGIQSFSFEGGKGQMFSDVPQFTGYLGYDSSTVLFYILNLRSCLALE